MLAGSGMMLNKIIYGLIFIAVVLYGYIFWAQHEAGSKKTLKFITEAEQVCRPAFSAFSEVLIGNGYELKGCRLHRVAEIGGDALYRGWFQYTGPLSDNVIMVFAMTSYNSQLESARLCANKLAFGANEEIEVNSVTGACDGADRFLIDYPHK
jgi:hypothetical protein